MPKVLSFAALWAWPFCPRRNSPGVAVQLCSLFVLALAVPARGLDAADIPGPAGGAVDTEEDRIARRMRDLLRADPAAADKLAERILASSLGSQLSGAGDPGRALGDIRNWINANPESAGHLAAGFAHDDARGNHEFERSLYNRVSRHFELSPERGKGILGRLDRVATESKLLGNSKDTDDEERLDLLKRFFEGESTSSEKAPKNGRGREASSNFSAGPGAYAGGGLYDRLSADNVTGYSPQVLAFQSEMNRTRPPGAPKLIETGTLDYPTLRHPYYGLRHDVERIEAAFREHLARSRYAALDAAARAIFDAAHGGEAAFSDPAAQKELESAALGKPLEASVARRQEDIAKARAALEAFDLESRRAEKPKGITPERVRSLAERRREAARWIAIAALEERLALLRDLAGFMTPTIESAIADTPLSEPLKTRYLARGARLRGEFESAAKTGEAALKLLRTPRSAKDLVEAERLIEDAKTAQRTLSEKVRLYVSTPEIIPARRWRAAYPGGFAGWKADFILKLLPRSSTARELRRERQAIERATEVFVRIGNE